MIRTVPKCIYRPTYASSFNTVTLSVTSATLSFQLTHWTKFLNYKTPRNFYRSQMDSTVPLRPLTPDSTTVLRYCSHPSPSALCRLPVEILQTIFLLCRPDTLTRPFHSPYSLFSFSPLPNQSEFPVLFVSHQWRSVALSVIRIYPPTTILSILLSQSLEASDRDSSNAVALYFLRKYILRTNPNNLSFTISNGYSSSISDNNQNRSSDLQVLAILKLLCELSDRWENVALRLLPSSFLSMCTQMRSLSRLTSIKLQDASHARGPYSGQLPSLMGAKHLSTLKIACRILGQPDLPIPWTQLTRVTLSIPYPRHFHFIITTCPNLVECVLKGYTQNTDRWTPPARPVQHLTLRKLLVKNMCKLSDFLPIVRVPGLQELQVDHLTFELEDARTVSPTALPSLRKLHLKFDFGKIVDPVVLSNIAFPPMVVLEFQGNMPDGLSSMLEHNDTICHLCLKFQETEDEVGLLSMVRARMRESSLFWLHIEACLSFKTLAQLIRLAESGMMISGLHECALVGRADRAFQVAHYKERRAGMRFWNFMKR
ncbi:hypothetical protein J3R30DRAFT_1021020 [Lentinula aciculospora]|uniref:F-box domain-containing protein n=1 Tax=Lentinula aciculospora TaxID=153920 RepID=A0A9W9A196_9AGAR|nr:hypothetical protein J3R30DRAFT_1021020 [Lentinula aciculospora]